MSSTRELYNRLYDFYGSLMTERQQKFFTSYYQDDYSLQEIAEEEGISRAAVSDALKHCRSELEAYENRLHLAEKYDQRHAVYELIRSRTDDEIGRMIDQLENIEFGGDKDE